MNVSILTLSLCLQGRVAVADADANEPAFSHAYGDRGIIYSGKEQE